MLIFLALLQYNIHITRHNIYINTKQYPIIDKKLLYKDTLYYCPDDVVFRKHDSILYYYKQGKYIKYKLNK